MALVLTSAEKQIARERIAFLEEANESLGERRAELLQGIDEVQPVEALNTRFFDFHHALVSAYEMEERGISGRATSFPVDDAEIDQAARVGGRLFPETHDRLPPYRIADLDGGTGQEPEHEMDGIARELSAIELLLTLDGADPSYQEAQVSYVSALEEELAALGLELEGLAMNHECGPGHEAYIAAETRKGVVESILATPDYSQGALEAERTAALARQQACTERLTVISGRLGELYEERYFWLDARLNLSCGTRNQLFALRDALEEVDDEIALNEAAIGRYMERM